MTSIDPSMDPTESFFWILGMHKTSVESVKLGKTLDLSIINFESLLPTADMVKGGTQNILNHLFFVGKAFIPNFRPLVPVKSEF